MAESITVNGVVFERVETLSRGWLYANGEVRFFRDMDSGCWTANVGIKWSQPWAHETPESALRDISIQANSWAPVLRELARINGGAV